MEEEGDRALDRLVEAVQSRLQVETIRAGGASEKRLLHFWRKTPHQQSTSKKEQSDPTAAGWLKNSLYFSLYKEQFSRKANHFTERAPPRLKRPSDKAPNPPNLLT